MVAEGAHQTSWLSCPCLPHTINGVDTDAMFAYETPKVVRIQDRSLGLIKLGLMLLIVCYVFIFSIWFKGQHFKKTDIEGIARLQWQEPVQKCNPKDLGCKADFSNLEDLPYCNQYKGKDVDGPQIPCSFFDARELPITLANGVLLPTRKDTFKQVRSAACPPGGNGCDKKFEFADVEGKVQPGSGEAIPVESEFVADVDDFTVLIDHSFRTANGMMECDDHFMQGYWEKCDEFHENCVKKKIFCVHDDCDEVGRTKCGTRFNDYLDQTIEKLTAEKEPAKPKSLVQENSSATTSHTVRNRMRSSRRASQITMLETDTDQISALEEAAMSRRSGDLAISIGLGDVFSLKTLLGMAGKSLDTLLPDSQDGIPRTIRSRGTALVVEVKYSNWEKWTLWKTKDPPEYTISVTSRPVEEFKQQSLTLMTNVSRELHIDYGVYIIMVQTGNLYFPNVLNMIITFAAGLVLLSVSNMVTDMMAMSLLPKSATYKDLKYQVSEDLTVDNDKKASVPAETVAPA